MAPLTISDEPVKRILTRVSGYLRAVCSHSLQPYRGCTFGRTLCGVSCYVQHNIFVTKGQPWGSFLGVRTNAASSYLRTAAAERAWAKKHHLPFTLFMSSSTDPFLPHEQKFRVTEQVLKALVDDPPDGLILQTHSHQVAAYEAIYEQLKQRCELRVHISIESDEDRLPGLPPPASSVAKRIAAAAKLKRLGINVVITVSPLLPIRDPERFFAMLSKVADAVVIDHFIGGDGSAGGSRTLKTPLPAAIRQRNPQCLKLDYRDEIERIARRYFPGRVGVGASGFAGVYR